MKVRHLVAIALLLSLAVSADAVQRRPLVEDYTNTGCPPCEAVKDSTWKILGTEYADLVTTVKPHGWWPVSSDEFYLFDIPLNTDRINHYSVNAVPTFFVDGKEKNICATCPGDSFATHMWYNAFRDTLDAALARNSGITIDVQQYRTPTDVFLSVDVTIVDTFAQQSGEVLLAVSEEWRRNAAGNATYYYILRDMVPGHVVGEPITMTPGSVHHFDWSYPLDAEYIRKRIISNVYVIRPSSHNVIQSWSAKPPLGVGVDDGLPRLVTRLEQNRPNPFNPTTMIRYNLNERGPVQISIFAPSGRLIDKLVGTVQAAGTHDVIWNGKDANGRDQASGVYYYRLDANQSSDTKKMILIR